MGQQSLAARFGVRLPVGTVVFRQGDAGGSVYVIRSGRVRVVIEAHGRQREVTILGPGDFFGEMAVMTGRPRSATVEVVEEVELLKLPADKLQDIITGDSEVAIRLLRQLAERLDHANRLIDVLIENDTSARIILALKDQLGDASSGPALVPVTVQSLALRLGLSAQDVNAALRRLSRVGVIAEIEGGVVVKDAQRLGAFLEFVRGRGVE